MRTKRKRKVVSWRSYFGAKAAGATIAGAAIGMLLMAVVGMLLGLFVLGGVFFAHVESAAALIFFGALVCGLSGTLGWYAVRGLSAAHRVAAVAPVTVANVDFMPIADTLVRGAVAPAAEHKEQLLRPATDSAAPDDTLLIAVGGRSELP